MENVLQNTYGSTSHASKGNLSMSSILKLWIDAGMEQLSYKCFECSSELGTPIG